MAFFKDSIVPTRITAIHSKLRLPYLQLTFDLLLVDFQPFSRSFLLFSFLLVQLSSSCLGFLDVIIGTFPWEWLRSFLLRLLISDG